MVVVVDLHAHQTLVEHNDRRQRRVPLTPRRSVGEVTLEVLATVHYVPLWLRLLIGHWPTTPAVVDRFLSLAWLGLVAEA